VHNATIIDGSRHVPLGDVDPAADGGLTEAEASDRLDRLTDELRELQELMFAAEANGVLVILQGMDAAGKDVTIQHVFRSATAEAIRVKHFKSPTEIEEKHDIFWRAHAEAPMRGELVIFDRSYYEQVVMPQVEGSTTDKELGRLHDDVLAFERLLVHGGTIVIKCYLHVSNEEQERRLVERMEDLETAWKISARDWTSRESWDDYMAAYETTMNATSDAELPWYVIPADHQWFHNLAIAELLVERLREHRDAWLAAREARAKEEQAAAREAAPDDVAVAAR
jgi:PPK2 family polyphosphate:nucleotide phosphotransferase